MLATFHCPFLISIMLKKGILPNFSNSYKKADNNSELEEEQTAQVKKHHITIHMIDAEKLFF
jgi:hypothetical protein